MRDTLSSSNSLPPSRSVGRLEDDDDDGGAGGAQTMGQSVAGVDDDDF